MTKKQSQKLAMYMAVLRILRNHPETVQSVPALAPLIAELERAIAEIQQAAARRRDYLTGQAQAKSTARETLARQVFTVSEAIRAHATLAGDTDLATRFSNGLSTLKKTRYVLLPVIADQVLAQARGLDAALQPYGIVPDTLDALERAVADYRPLLAGPREAQVQRAMATEALAEQFSGIDAQIIRPLDAVLNTRNGSELAKAYRRARRIAGARRGEPTTDKPETPALAFRDPAKGLESFLHHQVFELELNP